METPYTNQVSGVQQAGIQGLHSLADSIIHDNPEKLGQPLLEYLVSELGGASGSLSLLDAESAELVITAATGRAVNYIGKKILIGEGIIGKVAAGRRACLIDSNHPARPANGTPSRPNRDQPISAICWPLLVENQLRGVACVNRMKGQPEFAAADIENGQFLVNLLAVIVENSQLRAAQQHRIAALNETNEALQTKQKMLEQAYIRQRESETRLSAVIDNCSDAIVSVDAQGTIVMFNQGAQAVFGYSESEMLGVPLERLLPERFAASHRAHMQHFATGQETSRSMNYRGTIHGRRRDGSEFPAEASISRVVLGGKPLLTVMLRDISERVQAEETKTQLTAIIEGTTDIVGTSDPDGKLLYLNAAGRHFLGLAESAAIAGLRIADFHSPWALSQAMHEGIPYAIRDGSWSGESELRNRTGDLVPVLQLILAHKDANGRLLYLSSVMRSIADRKQAEEDLRTHQRELEVAYHNLGQTQSQLLQSEKMASIGQLAAGVAHEINNPVGYVNSNLGALHGYVDGLFRLLDAYAKAETAIAMQPALAAEIASMKQSLDLVFLREDTLNLVKESQEGLTRVKKIVQDLKEFSHVDRAEWQQADLHLGLDSTLNIVNNEIKYKAEVVKDYGRLPPVECISAQINQVFMNLLVNAVQAIEARGTITIRTGTDGEGVFVEITDTGKGMSAEVQKRVFEPFYTTKPVGKGTGLGLSLSYGIVQKHHGLIEVTSVPGQGTTFRVWLPKHQPVNEEVVQTKRVET